MGLKKKTLAFPEFGLTFERLPEGTVGTYLRAATGDFHFLLNETGLGARERWRAVATFFHGHRQVAEHVRWGSTPQAALRKAFHGLLTTLADDRERAKARLAYLTGLEQHYANALAQFPNPKRPTFAPPAKKAKKPRAAHPSRSKQ